MKKRRINTYDLILAQELGQAPPRPSRSGTRKNLVLSKSLDDGEILTKAAPRTHEEYVVGQSAEDIAFEEYVVAQSGETTTYEEYVVGLSADAPAEEYVVGCNCEPRAGAASLSAFEEIESVIPAAPVSDAAVQQELDTDLFQAIDREVSAAQNKVPPVAPQPEAPGHSKQQSGPELDFAETYSESDTRAQADDDDFINDMKAILSGEKTFDPVTKKAVNHSQVSRPPAQGNPGLQSETSDGHAIFKKIAENMQYANAYDLGTVELENRFADFDRIGELQKNTKPARQPDPSTSPTAAAPAPHQAQALQADHADFINDLDAIMAAGKQAVSEAKTVPAGATATADWPPRPSTIRPYTMQEKIAAFGQFTYEPDPSTFGGDGIRVTNNWAQQNIISVSIPQLNGKRMGNATIIDGTIQFHKEGAERLRALWAAWEQAGLLDRILTYEGGYAARFIRGTQNRNPRPLSNHAWGTAFDINAAWNGYGSEPALLGSQGCVRELVSIANSHGFFWGGHFRGKKDGMHFELGKTI